MDRDIRQQEGPVSDGNGFQEKEVTCNQFDIQVNANNQS